MKTGEKMEKIKVENVKYEITKIDFTDEMYPEKLRKIYDPPTELYLIGDVSLLNRKSIAIVGSRRCSEYGKIVATKIGSRAAALGITVVSGMASGIDSFGHKGALKAGGDTVAVLGCGIDICYPKSNYKLYEEIAENGLIVSEFPLGYMPLPHNFPIRNRIISGLSDKVVVVEAQTKSGSIITAELANEQGKEVFAVPGNINSQYSIGTNKLISDGAQIVSTIDDIFSEIACDDMYDKEELNDLGNDEKRIVEYIRKNGETEMERVCSELDISPSKINGLISVLEIKGYISYSMGKIFAINFCLPK